ncbi:unnamed protein product [Laminaria digitata]
MPTACRQIALNPFTSAKLPCTLIPSTLPQKSGCISKGVNKSIRSLQSKPVVKKAHVETRAFRFWQHLKKMVCRIFLFWSELSSLLRRLAPSFSILPTVPCLALYPFFYLPCLALHLALPCLTRFLSQCLALPCLIPCLPFRLALPSTPCLALPYTLPCPSPPCPLDLGRVLGYRARRVPYPACPGWRNPARRSGCLR